MTWDKAVKWLSGLAGAVAGLMGRWNALLTVLACLMVIDYLTGVIVAWRGRSPNTQSGALSSKAGFDGLIKKFFIMLVVLVAALLDRVIGNAQSVFQTAAALYYIANESISILENTSLMGVPCPAFLRRALEALRENADKGEKTDR